MGIMLNRAEFGEGRHRERARQALRRRFVWRLSGRRRDPQVRSAGDDSARDADADEGTQARLSAIAMGLVRPLGLVRLRGERHDWCTRNAMS